MSSALHMKKLSVVEGAAVAIIAVAVTVAAVAFKRWSSTSHAVAVSPVINVSSDGNFLPTVPNPAPALSQTPDGMVWIPGGEFSMGAMDPPTTSEASMNAARDARPIHRVYVDGFWMDKT